MEPVTEQCTPSSFNLSVAVDPTCNVREFYKRLFSRVLCRREHVESLKSALEGCPEELEYIDTLCMVSEEGLYCLASFGFEDIFPLGTTTVSTNCHDTSTCAPLCIATLNNITNIVGCCLNSVFNNTQRSRRDYYRYYSYEFWRRCGLTSPGFCEVRLTDGPRISDAAIIKASEKMVNFIGLLVILSVLLY